MNRQPLIASLTAVLFLLGGCSLLGDSPDGAKGGGGPGGGGRGAPSVVVSKAEATPIVDSVEAVGTARANEQADVNSTVTERIAKINFTDGQRVAGGAVVAELVQTAQQASLAENQARLKEAELQLDRLKQLQTEGFATKARIDQQQATVDIARAGTQAASSQISDRVIRAPFAGWLSLRRISPGTVVNAGTTIFTIVDHSKIKLDFTVPETYLPTLKPGLSIEAKAAAYPGESFHGEISSIDPVLDPVTRSATARAILPNPDLRLRPGMLMTVTIRSPARQAVTVPEQAVIGEGSGAYVWKVSADNVASRTDVTTGLRRDGRVEIITGLADGDRVVSEGTVKLTATGPVQPAGTAPATAGDAGQQAADRNGPGQQATEKTAQNANKNTTAQESKA